MVPLETNRKCFVWLCICPADESSSRWEKLAHTIFAMTATIGSIGAFAASLAYCWKFASIDFGKTMFSFLFLVAEFYSIYMALVGMFLLRHKIGPIFDNLSKIYKSSKFVSA